MALSNYKLFANYIIFIIIYIVIMISNKLCDSHDNMVGLRLHAEEGRQSCLAVFWTAAHISVGYIYTQTSFIEGEPKGNQPILYRMDRDGHDFHALFQYVYYKWVQNCTLIESFFYMT